MEYFEVDEAVLEKIFHMVRWAVMNIAGEDYPKNTIKIFMPFHMQRVMQRWAAQQHYLDDNGYTAKTLLLEGIEVTNGYEQDKVIITNCSGEYYPEHVVFHIVTFSEHEAVLNAGLGQF